MHNMYSQNRLGRALIGLVGAGLAMAVSGCAAPTLTPTPEPIEAPLPSATLLITPTSPLSDFPTLTVTPTPAVPLNTSGPWLTFTSYDRETALRSIWALNPDGTGLTQLAPIDDGTGILLTYAVQPTNLPDGGALAAFMTIPYFASRDAILTIVSLPGGEIQEELNLINDVDGRAPLEDGVLFSAAMDGGLAWSADGKQLAFIGQIDGASVDVYTYDVDSRKITRLSSGPDHAYRLEWSPDGQWVVHGAFQYIGMGGPGRAGLWAARADGSGSVTLFNSDLAGGFLSNSSNTHWLSDNRYVFASGSDPMVESIDLLAADLTTGALETLLTSQYYIDDAAYSPEHQAWLVTPEFSSVSKVPIILYGGGKEIVVADDLDFNRTWWSASYDRFFALTADAVLYSISADGDLSEVARLPDPKSGQVEIRMSPDETWWAWFEYRFINDSATAVSVGESMSVPSLIAHYQESDGVVSDIAWSRDSQRLFLFTRDGMWMATRPDFKLVQIAGASSKEGWYAENAEWIPGGE